MKYKDALKQSMEILAQDKNTIFIGYNICHGSEAYGTLKDIPLSQRLEMPVAESLMIGLATGMSLEGYRPVVFFERHDFVLNALDGIVNHLDKIKSMSNGQYKTPVIIRAIVGAKGPLDPGPQHTQDFTKAFKEMVNFPVYEPNNAEEIIKLYENLKRKDTPAIVIEKKDLYEN